LPAASVEALTGRSAGSTGWGFHSQLSEAPL